MSDLLLKYKAEMAKLKPSITTRDRKEAEDRFNKTKGTISQYINADDSATSVDLYYDLLPFFKERINKRLELLETL